MTITFYDAVSRERLLIATKADGVPRKGDRIVLSLHHNPTDGEEDKLPTLAAQYEVQMVRWHFSGGLYLDYSNYSNNLDEVAVYLDPLSYPPTP